MCNSAGEPSHSSGASLELFREVQPHGQAVCLVLLWGAHGTSLLGSAILQGPEEVHSPVETGKFLLAPAESRC